MHPGNLRLCDRPEDIELYNRLYSRTALAEIPTPEFLAKVGCPRNCDFEQYEVTLVDKSPAIPSGPGVNARSISFSMSQDMVPTREEVFNYINSSFIADFGGFLGLLLGLCCENIFDFVTGWVSRLKGKSLCTDKNK